jgi:hypothetical protein
MMRNHDTGPTAEELDELIRKLAAYRPLADFLRALGINPKTDDAKRLTAYMLAHLVLGVKKLPRAKPTKSKWSYLDDFALQIEVLRLRYEEGLGERAGIRKLAATWPFPYSPQKGRRSPKSNSKKQREDALWSRWMQFKRRRKAYDGLRAEFGPFADLFGQVGETRMSGRGIAIHQRRTA